MILADPWHRPILAARPVSCNPYVRLPPRGGLSDGQHASRRRPPWHGSIGTSARTSWRSPASSSSRWPRSRQRPSSGPCHSACRPPATARSPARRAPPPRRRRFGAGLAKSFMALAVLHIPAALAANGVSSRPLRATAAAPRPCAQRPLAPTSAPAAATNTAAAHSPPPTPPAQPRRARTSPLNFLRIPGGTASVT